MLNVSLVTTVLSACALASIHWHYLYFPALVFSLGMFFYPVLGYAAIRRVTETGWSWRLLAAALLSLVNIGLWILVAYLSLHSVRL